MTKLLIVNADDFGLCKEISEGIIKAFSDGIVKSTSVVANGRYFKEAIPFLRDSGIDVGIHLTLTGSEKPVSNGINGLVDKHGFFLKSYKYVVPRILLGHFDQEGLEQELSSQINLLLENKINITHIDSHQHLHLLPPIRDTVIKLAMKFKIKWIRVPQTKGFNLKMFVMNKLGTSLKIKLNEHGINSTDRFSGFEHGGHMNEPTLLKILGHLKDNCVTELMVHPGYDASSYYDWGYAWEDELTALTSYAIKEFIKTNKIILTSFREIK
jgi:predicted glycoside hydrolase/deacetylase ChbG (UPF0249 family)